MQKELSEFKEAASNRHWNECIKLTEKLLEQLDGRKCVLLAIKHVQEFLPIFEAHHPDTKWPRKRLEEILDTVQERNSTGSANFVLPEIDSEFETPGSNGFVTELEELWELVQSPGSRRNCPEKASKIIAGIIMVKMTRSWGMRNPHLWLRWYRSAIKGDASEYGLLAEAFMDDAEVAKLEIAEWHNVANQIQALLDK